jgi:hypothetical protein
LEREEREKMQAKTWSRGKLSKMCERTNELKSRRSRRIINH